MTTAGTARLADTRRQREPARRSASASRVGASRRATSPLTSIDWSSGDLESWAGPALGFLFGSGAGLVGLSCLLPGRVEPALALFAVAMASIVSGVLLSVRRTLSAIEMHGTLGLGTILIAFVVFSSGHQTSPDALLYVWVGLYAGVFARRRAFIGHVVVVALSYSVVLLLLPPDASRPDGTAAQHVLLVLGAVGVAGTWVALLKRAIDSLLAQQRSLARTDELTALPNRHAMLVDGTGDLEGAGALLVDLDRFKDVNDRFGHHVGDELLRLVADRLRAVIRPSDSAARLGGDEFVVIVHDWAAVTDVADRIVAALSRPFTALDRRVEIGCSIGIARIGAGPGLDGALSDADLAMYAAKDAGGGWCRFASPMRDDADERRVITNDLRDAVATEQFTLRYQPIVDLDGGRMGAVEALVRWEHPEHGLLAPDRFIPIAEATGSIVPIGRWVLNEACRTATTWVGHDPPAVTVNLSARQLLDPGLVDDVVEALRSTGLDPHRLILEITETSVIADPETALRRLHDLVDLGIRMAIDDFGTGYSSLDYLRVLPVEFIKLARPFVMNLPAPADRALASGVVELVHALGKRIVAEGVEEAEQAAVLREMGCDFAQGYHFARPCPADEIATIVAETAHLGRPAAHTAVTTTSA